MVRTFIKKISYIFIICSCVFICIIALSSCRKCSEIITKLTSSQEYRMENMGPGEIIPDIQNVKKQDGTTRLFIGDSVAFSILAEANAETNDATFACTNRAITIAGQYTLAKTYIANHSDATDIYLMMINDSFSAYFDYQYGYQYAVMPFVLTSTIDAYSETTIAKIKDTYGDFCLNERFMNLLFSSPLSLKLYLNGLRQFAANREVDEYDIAKEYLERMIQLCDENNINLHIILAPMADTKERREQTKLIEDKFTSSLFLERYPDFFDKAIYYPEEMFRDGTHFSNDVLDKNRENIIRAIEEKNNEIFGL